jgi:hypothetical protein
MALAAATSPPGRRADQRRRRDPRQPMLQPSSVAWTGRRASAALVQHAAMTAGRGLAVQAPAAGGDAIPTVDASGQTTL